MHDNCTALVCKWHGYVAFFRIIGQSLIDAGVPSTPETARYVINAALDMLDVDGIQHVVSEHTASFTRLSLSATESSLTDLVNEIL